MKTILLILAILIGNAIPILAQHSRSFGGKWTYVKIAGDSIKPTGLFMIDSLHGVLSCSRTRSWWAWYDLHSGNTSVKMYWYRTSDGGVSWLPINLQDAEYRDSACNDRPNRFSKFIFTNNAKTVYMGNNGLLSMDTCFSNRRFNILSSDNYGESWSMKSYPIDSNLQYREFNLLGSVSQNTLLLYHTGRKATCGELLLSSDYGGTFKESMSDKVFTSVTKAYNDTLGVTAIIRFDNSDMLHWTVTAIPTTMDFNCDTSKVGCGLTTLITTNAGATWSKYKYNLPGFETKVLFGSPQFVKNTSSLYYFMFTNGAFDDTQEGEINRYAGFDLKDNYYFRSESSYNTSYLYSSDFGKTWTPEHAYGSRRRGYEAVGVGNIWMTACKEVSIYVPERRAGLIVRTTDNGQTWEEDSSTLVIQDVGVFDGRIVSFSDPRHGWIAANDAKSTYIFKWVADEKSWVEPEVGRELETFRIKVFPNPSLEETNILLPETQSVEKVEVFNLLGRKATVYIDIENHTAIINTRTLPIGCYYLKVTTDSGATYIRPLAVMK